jgi:hypothetical protein
MADVLGNRRVDEDLDSVTVGSPSRMQVKVYFNVNRDDEKTLMAKCERALMVAEFLAGRVK